MSRPSTTAGARGHLMAGLTLVEMLVTLILISMIATVVMQGMDYLWRLQTSYNDVLDRQARHGMFTSWWRDSIRGLVTVKPQSDRRFSGSPSRLRGLSLHAPGAAPDTPAMLDWRIGTDGGGARALFYGDQRLLPLPEDAHFAYLDQQRRSHTRWPPADPADNPHDRQLPNTVLIVSDDAVLLAAAPMVPQAPVAPDLLNGQGDNFRI